MLALAGSPVILTLDLLQLAILAPEFARREDTDVPPTTGAEQMIVRRDQHGPGGPGQRRKFPVCGVGNIGQLLRMRVDGDPILFAKEGSKRLPGQGRDVADNSLGLAPGLLVPDQVQAFRSHLGDEAGRSAARVKPGGDEHIGVENNMQGESHILHVRTVSCHIAGSSYPLTARR
jgi:hypothetical protein